MARLALCAPTLGEDLTVIGTSIPLGRERSVDLLGVDRDGRPVIVVATPGEDENDLIRVLDVAAWLEDAECLLARLMPGLRSKGAGRSRLIFLAPAFGHRVARLGDLLSRLGIELIKYSRLDLGDQEFLLFETLSTGKATAARLGGATPCPAAPARAEDGRLTRQELEELSRPLGAAGG